MTSKKFFSFIFFLILSHLCILQGNESEEMFLQVPSAYKGRIRPLEAMARLWLEDHYHRQTIKPSQYDDFHIMSPSALMLLWKIHFTSHQNWDDIPLFGFIQHA